MLECTKLIPSLNEGGGGACWVQKRGTSYNLPSQTGVDWRTFAAGSWMNNTSTFLCLCVNLSKEQTLPGETAYNSCASASVEGCLSVLPQLEGNITFFLPSTAWQSSSCLKFLTHSSYCNLTLPWLQWKLLYQALCFVLTILNTSCRAWGLEGRDARPLFLVKLDSPIAMEYVKPSVTALFDNQMPILQKQVLTEIPAGCS